MSDYRPQELDKKWQQRWDAARAFEVAVDPSRPKFYCLEMFAYPSGPRSYCLKLFPSRSGHAQFGKVGIYIMAKGWAEMRRCRGSTGWTPFGWTLSACPRKTLRSRTASIPRCRPAATSRT